MIEQEKFTPIAEQLEGIVCDGIIKLPDPPISEICIGKYEDGHYSWVIGVHQKFNWLQKKMIKWCFGFEVKENK